MRFMSCNLFSHVYDAHIMYIKSVEGEGELAVSGRSDNFQLVQ